MRWRGVLIDLDGTLIDRDAALRSWLRARGVAASAQIDLLARDVANGRDLAVVSHALDIDAAAIRADLPGHVPAVDARTRAGLDRLSQAGLGLALVSNGGACQRAKLAAAGLDAGRFAAVVISGELGFAKPDPRTFATALVALGCAIDQAEQFVMVGDSPRADIDGAGRLDMTTVWIHGDRGRLSFPSDLRAPTARVGDFAEAAAWILARSGTPGP